MNAFTEKESRELLIALGQLSTDMHQVSMRECPTCRPISSILGQPFGCYAYQAKRGRPQVFSKEEGTPS